MILTLILLLPLGLGALLTLWPWPAPAPRRVLVIGGTLGMLAAALWLLHLALAGRPAAVGAGGWPAPQGIVLIADGLTALLLVLTAIVALAALAHAAAAGTDQTGSRFHALFQLQLFGITGALLAGDLFNLFVFFEVLLLASYGLLLDGRWTDPPGVALHYVLLNLMGSSLFLLGVALVYAAAGTLNMSGLAARLGQLAAPDLALAGAGIMLLATVLALKAALLPLLAWLPGTYAAAAAPAAALFTMLTKVGVYGLIRLRAMADGSLAGGVAAASGLAGNAALPHPATPLLGAVLLAAALATLAAGALGALAAPNLRRLVAWVIPVSVGTALAGVAAGGRPGLAAALYYLVQSTLITAGLFLLADLAGSDRDTRGPRPRPLLGLLFVAGVAGAAGMPPLSGFIGKALVLEAVRAGSPPGSGAAWPWVWAAVLAGSLSLALAFTRAGMRLFWPDAGKRRRRAARTPGLRRLLPAMMLIASGPLLVIFAGPAMQLSDAVAGDLLAGGCYATAVAALTAEAGGDRHR